MIMLPFAGEWADWKEWILVADCKSDPKEIRHRICGDPALGCPKGKDFEERHFSVLTSPGAKERTVQPDGSCPECKLITIF